MTDGPEQPTLFDGHPPGCQCGWDHCSAVPAVRLPSPDENRIGRFNDPATSGAPDTQRQAAVLVYYLSGHDRRRILDWIWERGAEGTTDYEIECHFGLKHQTASARRNDLLNDGWIEDSGRKRKTDSGRPAVVWVLTEEGRKQYAPAPSDVAGARR